MNPQTPPTITYAALASVPTPRLIPEPENDPGVREHWQAFQDTVRRAARSRTVAIEGARALADTVAVMAERDYAVIESNAWADYLAAIFPSTDNDRSA